MIKNLDTYENNRYRNKNACWIFYFRKENFPLRWHQYVEIIYSLQDGVVLAVNGKKIRIDTGEMLFIWPGELHAILQCPPGDTLILQFDADLITERTDFKNDAYLFYETRVLRREKYPELLQKLGGIFMELNDLGEKNQPMLEMRSCILLYRFFIELWEGLRNTKRSDRDQEGFYETETARRISEMCRYISRNCGQKLTLAAAAAAAGFSKCYFSKMFKLYTDQNFVDFLTKERLRVAETLLREPEMSITGISQEAGFNSIATFNRVFLKEKKVNPTTFRKMYCVYDDRLEEEKQ